jgi:carbamoyltransferase
VNLEDPAAFSLNLEYFRHWTGEIAMSWDSGRAGRAGCLHGSPDRFIGSRRGAPTNRSASYMRIWPRRCNAVFEECAFHVLRGVHAKVPTSALCLAGGCAMNSVANGKIRQNTPFTEVFIQPAAGDNGTALGAALDAWHAGGNRSNGARMQHSYWGTEYDDGAIAQVIRDSGVVAQQRCTLTTIEDEAALCDETAALLADGAVVGWFQGRMEWGRARARQPQHPRRPAAARHARHHQPEDQVPRALPAFCAVGARRSDR